MCESEVYVGSISLKFGVLRFLVKINLYLLPEFLEQVEKSFEMSAIFPNLH